ncbi:MAG: HepT-like ribonuclease domain-containing protein [Steroidobacteraceae bacterium]
MSHPERVEDYLEHIADAIERAIRYTGSLGSLAALEQDELAQDAIVRTLTVIGEAAVRLYKEAPQFVTEHPELPWSRMRGIRNKVVHDYFDVAWDVVWDTVKQDLPPLLDQVKALLKATNGGPPLKR